MRRLGVLLLLLVFVWNMGTPALAAPTVVKYATGTPSHDPIEDAAYGSGLLFKSLVETRTGGRYRVEYLGGAVVGGEREQAEGVKLGTFQMASISDGALPGFCREMLVLGIPYLFSSQTVAWDVLDGPFGKELFEVFRQKTGIRILGITEVGFRNFTNKVRPIKGPQDLKGLKFRVMENPAHMAMVRAMGGDPTPIPAQEIYTALQTGVVDGQENPVPIIEMYKLHEVQKYLTLDGHIYSPQFILINEKFYQSLSPEDQYVFADSARIAAAFHRGLRAWAQATGIERLQKQGMEVYAPTMDEIKAFREVAQPAAIEYVESQIGKEWVSKILKAVEEAEHRQLKEIK